MRKLSTALVTLFLFLSPFYDGTCGRAYQIGWPLPVITFEAGYQQSRASTFLNEIWNYTPHLEGAIVLNAVFFLLFYYGLIRYFNSSFYQNRSRDFRFSNLVCGIYSTLFCLIGWYFIGWNPAEAPLNILLFWIYLYPILYTGGLVVLWINKYTFDAKPIHLMPWAYALSLLIYYVSFYKLSQFYFRKFRKRSE